MEFKTTRASAIENLDNFIKNNLGEYSKLRNFDFGPDKRSNTSCLSPYITHGVINEKEVISKSLERSSFTKNEKFLVIKGNAQFKFKNIDTGERYILNVDGSTPTIIDTIPGWAHDITNIGQEDLVVMLWANEIFDPEKTDTITQLL